jgi:hypothetical protein
MTHDWIIDVLIDLKTFARSNGLEALADQLDDSQMVAQIEIASHAKGTACGLRNDESVTGRDSGAVRAR